MNNRGLRGGAFNNNDNNLQSSNRLRAQYLLGEALGAPARGFI
jgi:hypothetical protein